jgi:hypothetical protein
LKFVPRGGILFIVISGATLNRSRLAVVPAAILLVIAAALPAPARGETPSGKEKARTYFKRAVILFEGKDYEGALDNFLQSYEASPNEKLKYNIGICYLNMGRFASAGNALEDYLHLVENLPAGEKEMIDGVLGDVAEKTGLVVVSADLEGAGVFIDGAKAGTTPLGHAVHVEPGSHTIEVAGPDGASGSKTVDVDAGGSVDVEFTLLKEKEPPAGAKKASSKAPAPAEGKRKTAIHPAYLYASLGLTAAMLVGGAITGGLALKKRGDIKDLDRDCVSSGCNAAVGEAYDTYEEHRERLFGEAKDLALAGTVLWAAAGAFAAAGIVLLVLRVKAGEKKPPAQPRVSTGMTAGGFFVRLEFI